MTLMESRPKSYMEARISLGNVEMLKRGCAARSTQELALSADPLSATAPLGRWGAPSCSVLGWGGGPQSNGEEGARVGVR